MCYNMIIKVGQRVATVEYALIIFSPLLFFMLIRGQNIMSYNHKIDMYEGFIYCIKNDINLLLYIGQTTRTISIRFTQHKSESKINQYNSLIHQAMKKYGVSHFYVEELLKIECHTKDELYNELNKKEIEYIARYNTVRPNGYNISSGGENARNPRKIDFYTNNGEFVKCYDSVSSASIDNNITEAAVYNLCNGKTSYSSVGVFRYHGNLFNEFPVVDLRNKEPVDVYNTIGYYICTCDSFADAAIRFQTSPACICGVCNGEHSHSNYFVFRYNGETFNKYDVQSFIVGKYNVNNELVDVYLSPNDCMSLNCISKAKMYGHLNGNIQIGRDGYYYRYIKVFNEYENFLLQYKINFKEAAS